MKAVELTIDTGQWTTGDASEFLTATFELCLFVINYQLSIVNSAYSFPGLRCSDYVL